MEQRSRRTRLPKREPDPSRVRQTGVFVNQSQNAASLRDNRFIPSPKAAGKSYGAWPLRKEPSKTAERERLARLGTWLNPQSL